MFGVSTEKPLFSAGGLMDAAIDETEAALLSRFCIADRWTASLNNAMLHLGPRTCVFHGLDPEVGRFGLLEFVRCYEPRAAREIVGLFEQAAARGLSFHYSAPIGNAKGRPRLVHCFAEVEADKGDGRLTGLFLLPRPETAQAAALNRF